MLRLRAHCKHFDYDLLYNLLEELPQLTRRPMFSTFSTEQGGRSEVYTVLRNQPVFSEKLCLTRRL